MGLERPLSIQYRTIGVENMEYGLTSLNNLYIYCYNFIIGMWHCEKKIIMDYLNSDLSTKYSSIEGRINII